MKTEPTRYPFADTVFHRIAAMEDELVFLRALVNRFELHTKSDVNHEKIRELIRENIGLRAKLLTHERKTDYENWFESVFKMKIPTPNTWPFTTFKQGTPWCDKVVYGMQDGEILLAEHLLENLENDNVPGDIVEFGTYYGHWLQVLAEMQERRGWSRTMWGFDSFEGLPSPKEGVDPPGWSEGMYSAPFEEVKARLLVNRRPWLHLVKGWFDVSLQKSPATNIQQVAYARIDGDLYASAVPCLEFLTNRLSDKAILVFDDWQFSTEMGEVKAFREWIERYPIFEFEFLGFNMWAHLYLRVHRLADAVPMREARKSPNDAHHCPEQPKMAYPTQETRMR